MLSTGWSTVARVRRKAEDEGGMRERKKEKIAIAKAMSVAIGTVSAASEPLCAEARGRASAAAGARIRAGRWGAG